MHKQGWKRPLDTPKRMIERREREGEREKKVAPECVQKKSKKLPKSCIS